MVAWLRGEALRWRGSARQLSFVLSPGGRMVAIGGTPVVRETFRRLVGGERQALSPEGFGDGCLFWRGRDATRLRPWQRRTWRRSTIWLGTNPYTSLLPDQRVGTLWRELGRRGGEPEAVLSRAHLPSTILPWRVEALSGVMRARLLYAIALARSPELLIVGDLSSFLEKELWYRLLEEWLAATPSRMALLFILPTLSEPLRGLPSISLDF